ncbi:hypothetical protein CEXT_451111 [Caerostris extrusa]|uniref:Uncharacterized protein n=1 Tax=Caerostris extrusa TaxID=172846 RepID=A0AAV4Y518_CAEEX|nr:hypothetical protein CEXT_451111 [Caerostris extrusa]
MKTMTSVMQSMPSVPSVLDQKLFTGKIHYTFLMKSMPSVSLDQKLFTGKIHYTLFSCRACHQSVWIRSYSRVKFVICSHENMPSVSLVSLDPPQKLFTGKIPPHIVMQSMASVNLDQKLFTGKICHMFSRKA